MATEGGDRCDGTGTRLKLLPQTRLYAKLRGHENIPHSNPLRSCVPGDPWNRPGCHSSSHQHGANSTQESYPEKEYFSKIWNTEVVTNVTKPSLTVFKPSPELRNGTALVICPGGGFMALSINSEGNDVAKYVAARGVTAFVLKYRLAHTGEDATQEFVAMLGRRTEIS